MNSAKHTIDINTMETADKTAPGTLSDSNTNGQTATDTALGLVEIRTHIGTFLSRKDIHSCRLVNKDWAECFFPFLWCNVSLRNTKPIRPIVFESARFIQYLGLPYRLPDAYHLKGLSRLTSLFLWLLWEENSEDEEGSENEENSKEKEKEKKRDRENLQALQRFLREECSLVQSFSIQHDDDLYFKEIYAAVEAGFHQLEDFTLSGEDISDEGFRAVWKAICVTGAQKLRMLSVHPPEGFFVELLQQYREGGQIQRHDEPQEYFNPMTKLRKIKMSDGCMSCEYEMEADDALAMLLLCPDLESICLSPWPSTFHHTEFAALAGRGYWKRLCSLSGWLGGMVDDDVAKLIRGMHHVKTFKLIGSGFGPAAFEALRGHPAGFKTLQKLTLSDCPLLTSEMLQTVLEESPRLSFIDTPVPILVRDVLQGRPWSCTKALRQLRVGFLLSDKSGPLLEEEEYAYQNKAMLARIATLTGLERLMTSSGKEHETTRSRKQHKMKDRRFVAFDVEGGLDQLKVLTQLDRVYFTPLSQPWGLDEVDWVLGHWRRLEQLGVGLQRGLKLTDEQTAKVKSNRLHINWNRAL